MPRMTGAKFMVQTVQAYGVTHAFYMPMVVTRANDMKNKSPKLLTADA